jgi:proteasome accessory factor B
VFRLSRVQGAVSRDGEAGSYEVPPDTDLRALTQSLAPPPADRTAEVLVRHDTGHGMRRHATTSSTQDGGRDGWDRLTVTYGARDAFADEVLSYGADVVVLEPAELRRSVVRRLEETVRGVSP